MFTPASSSDWPRRDHYRYYQEDLPCGYSVTVRLDVTGFRRAVHVAGLPFNAAFVWCVSQIITKVPELRMGVDSEGRPGFYDVLHPVYTIFHEDDHTFSDLWTYHNPDLEAFCRQVEEDKRLYGGNKGHNAREGMPQGFYCISCVPWLDFTGYATYLTGGRQTNLFPVITYGKYTLKDGRWELPFSVTISHAAADGWHISQFVQMLQEGLGAIEYPPLPGEENL